MLRMTNGEENEFREEFEEFTEFFGRRSFSHGR
jgi:hypothetical protein